jgi:hypothetical protein
VCKRSWLTHRVIALRILFDNNVPAGVRRFLAGYEVRTVSEMNWHPHLENGELLKAAEPTDLDVTVTSDQNILYQQNLKGRKLALVVLGSNIWPIVSGNGKAIAAKVNKATPGSYDFIEMPLPPKPRRRSTL